MQEVDELVDAAMAAFEKGAVTYCMVTSTRGPTNREVDVVSEAARIIKEKYPLRLCASLGLLKDGQAERLKASGVDRYNHNIETSERHFANIVTKCWRSASKKTKSGDNNVRYCVLNSLNCPL